MNAASTSAVAVPSARRAANSVISRRLLRVVKLGCEGPQMRFEPRAHLQGRRVDLDIAARGKEIADGTQDSPALLEPAAPRREAIGPPPFLHRPALVLADPPTYVSFYRAPFPRSDQ